ncbi:MAG: monovalent cation/H+ antiporter subunit A [Pseudomonadota bacterium]
MSLVLIAALPFLGAILCSLAIRFGRGACASAAGLVAASALYGVLGHVPAILQGEVIRTRIDWMPSLGLNANFMLDGLGLLFAILILGFGVLIILYARFYLAGDDPAGPFFAGLMLFQGAMLGIVLSDNIVMLLIFWELTSLSSFLLIGYWKHLPEARQGARMALAVTGGGGLALIAGILLLGQIAGSYDLGVILTQKDAVQASGWYLPALILILLGAFTKSAQVPFHFWLPHAMAAPTPVSAYLHSATMVQAGIFLMARLWPVLAGTDAWFWIVASTGLVTMLTAAKIALYKDDLKAVLAFSTVSHLGLITMLLGFGTRAAAAAAVFHIITHATFKAALFLLAGIVDHDTGTRDLRRLGGLRTLMPITFGLTALASLSMAGLPPLNGFLSKEMMLAEAAQTVWLTPWAMGVFATVGALLSVAYSLRLLAQGFLGRVRDDYPQTPHDPGPGLWLAPALLVTLVVAIGIAPMQTASWLVDAAAGAVTGTVVRTDISLWHGVQAAALWMSLTAIGGGLVVLGLYPRLRAIWDAVPRPEAKTLFDGAMSALIGGARQITRHLHDGAFSRMAALAVATTAAAAAAAFLTATNLPGTRTMLPVTGAAAVLWIVLVLVILATLRHHRDRLFALILTGLVGLVLATGFAYLSAPDLALTQLMVEVVTVLLMLIALNFLPRDTPVESGTARRLRDGVVAGVAGLGTALLAFALMTREAAFPPISAYHLAQSKPGAGGSNAVNTIIVDFRGYDTFGEIIVLGIAALVIFALTETVLHTPDAIAALRREGRAARAGDRQPMMLAVATRFLLPLTLTVGVYLYLRGHNLPGGGFVAGLVVSVAFLMQFIGSGFAWSQARQRWDHHLVLGAGILVAWTAGAGAWVFGLPFLTSGYQYVTIWPLETFELTTASIFDLGILLCVMGAVLLALASLSRLTQAAQDAPSGPEGRR